MHIKGMRTGYTNYYNKLKADELDMWPPKYWKFQLETDSNPKVEVAFTDPRRFGRVRLVDCSGSSIRKHSPLVENGPDPVVDANTTFTEDYFMSVLKKRHVPIKALLLDQAFISGIGNWVGDEVLFHAKLHPEQYCDEFSDAQIKTLYGSIRYVCQTAVDLLGDSDQFPNGWLFQYRWGKGSKNTVAQLPNGEKLSFLTVGGRTSCFAPALQKKSGNVAPGIKEEPVLIKPEKSAKAAGKTNKPAAPKKNGKGKPEPETDDDPVPAADEASKGKKRKRRNVREDNPAAPATETKTADIAAKKAKTGRTSNAKAAPPAKAGKKAAKQAGEAAEEKYMPNTGRRRSTRLITS